jgi:hypothetical protein
MDFGSFHLLLFLPGRYNLMANRVLLLLAMASRSVPNFSSKILSETAGEYLSCYFVIDSLPFSSAFFPHFNGIFTHNFFDIVLLMPFQATFLKI